MNKTTFKTDLVNRYAERTGITKVEAERRFNDVLDLITDELYAGNDVKLNHFFNFFVKELAAKNGKNPVTKEDMVIPKVKTIRVRMTKPVKDAIQGKKA